MRRCENALRSHTPLGTSGWSDVEIFSEEEDILEILTGPFILPCERKKMCEHLYACTINQGGKLPFKRQKQLVSALVKVLSKGGYTERIPCIRLLTEVLKGVLKDVQDLKTLVIPHVIWAMREQNATIHQELLKCLEVCLKVDVESRRQKNLEIVMETGVEVADSILFSNILSALPRILDDKYKTMNFYNLISSLSTRLSRISSEDQTLVTSALVFINNYIGFNNFNLCLKKLPASLKLWCDNSMMDHLTSKNFLPKIPQTTSVGACSRNENFVTDTGEILRLPPMYSDNSESEDSFDYHYSSHSSNTSEHTKEREEMTNYLRIIKRVAGERKAAWLKYHVCEGKAKAEAVPITTLVPTPPPKKSLIPTPRRRVISGYKLAPMSNPEELKAGLTIRQKEASQNTAISSQVKSTPSNKESDKSKLKPLYHPEASVVEALRLLADSEWEKKIKGLNLIRCLTVHHPRVAIEKIRDIRAAVTKEVKNLRSGVSRAAIVCLGDMFTHLKKDMSFDLDGCIKILLHKAGESNNFIREDVDKTLSTVVQNVIPRSALVALINGGLSHLNTAVKSCAAQHLAELVELTGADYILGDTKDITNRALPAIAKLAQDSAQETRKHGRNMLNVLMSHPAFGTMLKKYIPARNLTQVYNVIKQLKK